MSKLYLRYLKLLGIPEEPPCILNLKQILRAHLKKIPFENISKLYYLRKFNQKSLPDLNQFLDGIEQFGFGSTCYANNYHLNGLLRYLGYDALLCGADMGEPDVHLVNIVRAESREFIADAGYAAPFLSPLPRDLNMEYRIKLGHDEYVLAPKTADDRSRLTLYREGNLCHGYSVNPKPRKIEEFSGVILDSYSSHATFMNSILLVRFGDNFSKRIHNMTYLESKGISVKKKNFRNIMELTNAIREIFSIPPEITKTAIEGLSMNRSAWS